jgi:hypothetical protein
MPNRRDRSAQLTLIETDEDSPALDPDASWACDLLDTLQVRRTRSPLEAEVAASTVASAWHPGVGDDLGLTGRAETVDVEGAAGRMMDAIASVRRTDALVLLVALARVARPPLSERALAAASALEAGGLRAPKWLPHVGRVEPTGAWRMSHTLGDGDNLVLGFRHSDDSEHSIVVYIDHNLGGLATDAFLADRPTDTLEMFSRLTGHDPDLLIEPIPLADAAASIRSALEATDRDWPTLQTEDYPAIRPLLDARLSLLPNDRTAPPVVQPSETERAELIEHFLSAPEGRRWRADPAARELAERLLRFRCEGSDGRPLRWSTTLVDRFLLDQLPTEATDALVALAPAVLTDWIRFSARRTGLADHLLDETLTAVADRTHSGGGSDAGSWDLDTDAEPPRLDDIEVVANDLPLGQMAVTSHPEPVEWTGVPRDLRARVQQIVDIVDRACEQVLDAEYQTLARRLTAALARKRPSPLRRGRPEIWAGGILWALGRVNWLFAHSATVHVTGEQLAEAVGAKPKSIAAKADMVGKGADIGEFDPRFTRQELLDMGLFAARLRYRY